MDEPNPNVVWKGKNGINDQMKQFVGKLNGMTTTFYEGN